MQWLDALTDEAANETEVSRQMHICNACRYCEGFCAVFPAMTRRLEFAKADVHYLANLCHSCGACYHSCQYATPHEFAVDLPRAMSKLRVDTYAEYAWPRSLGALYRRNGLVLSLATAVGLVVFLLGAMALHGSFVTDAHDANFYAVFPHNLLAWTFGAVFTFACVAYVVGVGHFWRTVSGPTASGNGPGMPPGAALEATSSALSLRYLGGGHGDGCNEEDDRYTLARRRFHHLTFYGFMLCFASTLVATLYHYLFAWEAPYPLTSVPVVLGTVGGVGLVLGPIGLLWLNVRRDPMQGNPAQAPMDRGFSALLLLISITGLALLAWRTTSAMPTLLAVHLGVVMAFFATMPYSKMAHGIYRSAALLKYAIEKRRPNRLGLGAE